MTQRKRILLIDDDEDLRNLVSRYIKGQWPDAEIEAYAKPAGVPYPKAAQFDHLSLALPDEEAPLPGLLHGPGSALGVRLLRRLVLLLGEFEHRATYHKHTHDHAPLRHAHKEYELDQEGEEHHQREQLRADEALLKRDARDHQLHDAPPVEAVAERQRLCGPEAGEAAAQVPADDFSRERRREHRGDEAHVGERAHVEAEPQDAEEHRRQEPHGDAGRRLLHPLEVRFAQQLVRQQHRPEEPAHDEVQPDRFAQAGEHEHEQQRGGEQTLLAAHARDGAIHHQIHGGHAPRHPLQGAVGEHEGRHEGGHLRDGPRDRHGEISERALPAHHVEQHAQHEERQRREQQERAALKAHSRVAWFGWVIVPDARRASECLLTPGAGRSGLVVVGFHPAISFGLDGLDVYTHTHSFRFHAPLPLSMSQSVAKPICA